jgi:ketosteroid isomerase-like protein
MADAASIVRAGNDEFSRRFKAQDAKGMSELYAPNGGLVAPPGANGQIFEGREAVAGFWQGAMNAGLKEVTLTSHKVDQVAPEVIVELGSYKHNAGSGNYIVVWKKVNGKWYLQQDLFN